MFPSGAEVEVWLPGASEPTNESKVILTDDRAWVGLRSPKKPLERGELFRDKFISSEEDKAWAKERSLKDFWSPWGGDPKKFGALRRVGNFKLRLTPKRTIRVVVRPQIFFSPEEFQSVLRQLEEHRYLPFELHDRVQAGTTRTPESPGLDLAALSEAVEAEIRASKMLMSKTPTRLAPWSPGTPRHPGARNLSRIRDPQVETLLAIWRAKRRRDLEMAVDHLECQTAIFAEALGGDTDAFAAQHESADKLRRILDRCRELQSRLAPPNGRRSRRYAHTWSTPAITRTPWGMRLLAAVGNTVPGLGDSDTGSQLPLALRPVPDLFELWVATSLWSAAARLYEPASAPLPLENSYRSARVFRAGDLYLGIVHEPRLVKVEHGSVAPGQSTPSSVAQRYRGGPALLTLSSNTTPDYLLLTWHPDGRLHRYCLGDATATDHRRPQGASSKAKKMVVGYERSCRWSSGDGLQISPSPGTSFVALPGSDSRWQALSQTFAALDVLALTFSPGSPSAHLQALLTFLTSPEPRPLRP